MAEKELITFTHLEAVLQEYAANAKEIYGKNLSLGGKRASGDLIDSVRSQVVTTKGGYEVELSLNYYWKFIEGGTKGEETSPAGAVYPAHMPPPRVLEQWINIKPILPRPNADGHIPSPRDLSWAMAKSIEKKGIAPHPALAQTIDELNAMYSQRLAEALALDTQGYIMILLGQIHSQMPTLQTSL